MPGPLAISTLRVAIVGGHPVIVGVVRMACEGQPGIEVVDGAGTGRDAIRMMVACDPDVLVLDLELPDRDGLEVLAAIRRDGFTGATLVLSDRTDGATVLEALRVGVSGYLTKGADLRRVGSAVVRLAAGERVIDPALGHAAILELANVARRAREGAHVTSAMTGREREVLELLAEGLTMRQIGRRLQISPRTVESHVGTLYRKLGVRTRVQAVARAATLGLIDIR